MTKVGDIGYQMDNGKVVEIACIAILPNGEELWWGEGDSSFIASMRNARPVYSTEGEAKTSDKTYFQRRYATLIDQANRLEGRGQSDFDEAASLRAEAEKFKVEHDLD